MATDGARRFWSWLDAQQRARGEPVRLRARFSGDPTARVAVPIEVEAGEPRVRLAGDLRAAYDALDPAEVAAGYEDPEEGKRWRDSFERAGADTWLTLNAACRLILGPRFRPARRVHAFNANVELHVDPADAARWIEDVDVSDPSWPSLSDLIQRFEDRDSMAPGRPPVGHTPGRPLAGRWHRRATGNDSRHGCRSGAAPRRQRDRSPRRPGHPRFRRELRSRRGGDDGARRRGAPSAGAVACRGAGGARRDG